MLLIYLCDLIVKAVSLGHYYHYPELLFKAIQELQILRISGFCFWKFFCSHNIIIRKMGHPYLKSEDPVINYYGNGLVALFLVYIDRGYLIVFSRKRAKSLKNRFMLRAAHKIH